MSTGFEWFGGDEPAQHDPSQPDPEIPGAGVPDGERPANLPPGRRRDYRDRRPGQTTESETPGREGGPAAGAQRARGQAGAWRSDLGSRDSDDRGRRAGADHDRRGQAKVTAIPYPIVDQQVLDDPVRRGRVPMRRRREDTEIPKLRPHEVLVWRVGNQYIVDQRELRPHDYNVVRASSVSVVSVRPGTEVQVRFRIDTQDAAEFAVQVTFACSVIDPVTVVRDGQVSAADALLAYLHGYQDLFQLGLKYSVADVNKIRTAMAFHIKSYMTHYPPRIPGIEIASLATVQVETPATLGRIQEISQERDIKLAERAAEAEVVAQVQDGILTSQRKISDAIGDDPRDAIIYAHAEGSITSQEAAVQLQQLYEAEEQRDQVEAVARNTREYAKEDRDAEWAHEERVWQRKQIEKRNEQDRKDQRDKVKANLGLLKIYADHGWLDTVNPDIENIIRRIQGDVPAASGVGGGDQFELPEGQSRDPEADENVN